jgi:hypothetical protein
MIQIISHLDLLEAEGLVRINERGGLACYEQV